MFTYTFQQLDQNKSFLLTATKNSLSTSITLNCKAQEIEQGSDPIEDSEVSGSFPTGLSDSYFSIIYHTDESYYQTLDINELNAAARTYLSYVTPDVDTSNKVYYGQDSEGIYVAIPTSNLSTTYSNNIYSYNSDGTVASYKVYIAGTCEIIDMNITSSENNIDLALANGYYYNIAGKLYLFLNTSINMVCFSTNSDETTDYSEFWYYEKEDDIKTITSDTIYKNNAYYLKHFSNSTSETTENLATDEDAMMITGAVIDSIITSNTLLKIEHFNGCPNVPKVILSESLTEIGDYAFYNSSLAGLVSTSVEESNIIRIGKYAFSGCSNIKLFLNPNNDKETLLPTSLQEIDDYAFYSSSGLDNFNLSNCNELTTVGYKAFANCSNLRTVTYLESQVESDSDDNTRLLYLPPDKGSSGNYASRKAGEDDTVTVTYSYDYTDWIVAASDEDEKAIREAERNDTNNNYCFYGDTNIEWICK